MDKTPTYNAVYKCRLCGQVYRNGTTTGESIALLHITQMAVGMVPSKLSQQVPKMEVHNCSGTRSGGMGLADFQGWEAEP